MPHLPRPTPRRANCNAHKQMRGSDGKPFVMADHLKRYRDEGLVTSPKELRGATKLNFKPPGKPQRQGGRWVYPTPAWHFGKPM